MAVPKTAALPLGDTPAIESSQYISDQTNFLASFFTPAIDFFLWNDSATAIMMGMKPDDQFMYCIHIASEMAPVAKVGGLADVLLGLCRELSWKGHDVDIIIPKYDCMDSNDVRDLSIVQENLLSYYEGEWYPNTVWEGWVENLKVYFLEPRHPRLFFHRGCFYGCDDDVERYLYFSRACMEFINKKGLKPDIIHLHDWQTAVLAPMYAESHNSKKTHKAKVLFTIHNIEYQGKCSIRNLDQIGLKGVDYLNAGAMQDPYQSNLINLLKGGIVYSDYITTVSPNYAKEVKTPTGGRGLDKLLVQSEKKFSGILNGIDYSYWNPEIDRYLPAHFSPRETPENKKDNRTLDKKAYVKKILRERLNLSELHRPIVGCITRLVPQKGIELIKYAMKYAAEHNGQFVLLGSSPIPSINTEFQELKHQYADDANVHMALHHQEELAHLIYAGSDMLIVPSLFEPCGLTQMIALKYGTIPIVRKTGGLADTIFDVDYSGRPFKEANGYVFDYPDQQGVVSAMSRAFHCWFQETDKWRHLMINGMNIDFSWDNPSNQYLEIYRKLTGNTQ